MTPPIEEIFEEESCLDGLELPAFPQIAWRGPFADFRDAMAGTTEASDVAHFGTLLSAIAANLGRNVWMYDGSRIYPNVYVLFFGESGDKKTTAQRRALTLDLVRPDIQILRGGGTPEGISDALDQHEGQATVWLQFCEEISTLFAQGRWQASSILEFLTEAFDCPGSYRMEYRKKRVDLYQPTPTILAATTPDWFWKNARPQDFYGVLVTVSCISLVKRRTQSHFHQYRMQH
jgi:hypothetical protein